jgi:hypothetical protein
MIFISERGLEAQVSKSQSFKVSMLPEKSYRKSKFQGNRKHQVLRSSLPRNKKEIARQSERS